MMIQLALRFGLFFGGGFLSGILSGLFGVGGGALVVPLLLLLGLPIHHAIVLSLGYILSSSLSGSLKHWQQQNIALRTALSIALAALAGVYLGLKINVSLPPHWLAWAFAGFMGVVLGLFFQKSRFQADTSTAPATKAAGWPVHMVIGLIAGICSSLFGVGGGVIIVPLLNVWTPLDIKQATGTSLATVSLIACSGVLQHLLFGKGLDAFLAHLPVFLCLCAGGLLGAPLGAQLNQRGSEKQLRQGFIGFSLLILVYMLFYGFQARS